MIFTYDKNAGAMILPADDFDIEQTFECGQSFRWNNDGTGAYTGIVGDKCLKLTCRENKVFVYCNEKDFEDIWKSYFDLELDYCEIKKQLRIIHPVMEKACDFAPGIRILRQDAWEAMISFIISQNNNIKRIKGIVESLCTNFGDYRDGVGYLFPTAERLACLSEDDLAVIKSGFRAKYILDASRKVHSGEIKLQSVSRMPIDQAREMLMQIKGVGPKVAECILLYGMHRLECFPLDVWMKRAMQTYFPDNSPQDFGEYAGIAQQYIFHYSRMNPDELT